MKKKASVEKYYITNGDKYIGRTDAHQFTMGVPVAAAARFKKEEAENLIPQIYDNSQGEWTAQKYFSAASKKNYVITNATKFVSSNSLVVNDVSKARSFKYAADAKAYIDAHSELLISMGDPIIVNEKFEPVDHFGKRLNCYAVAKKINLSQDGVVKTVNRVNLAKQLRIEVYNRDNGTCQLCGKPLSPDNFTVDHIIPLKRGGIEDMSNYRCVCKRCNEWKADSLDEEKIRMLGEIGSNYFYKHHNSELMDRYIRSWVWGILGDENNQSLINENRF